jgi:hypothetical protein
MTDPTPSPAPTEPREMLRELLAPLDGVPFTFDPRRDVTKPGHCDKCGYAPPPPTPPAEVRTVKSGDWGDPSVWEGGALTSNPHHIRVDDMGALEEAKQTSALLDLCESAWGIIANASEGNWEREHPTWREAAAQWRERYHRVLIPPLTARRGTGEGNR